MTIESDLIDVTYEDIRMSRLTDAECRAILEIRLMVQRRRHQMLLVRVDGQVIQFFTASSTVRMQTE